MMVYNNFMPKPPVCVVDKDGKVTEVPYETPKQKDFAEYYYDREVVEVPRPVEGSDDEYILVLKVKESKRSVEEVINSQADDVGLDNMIRKFEMTGDSSCLPSNVNASDEVVDLTSLPSDSAEYFDYIHKLYEQYQQLPIELRQDMSMEDFVKKVSNDDVLNYFKSIQNIESDKKEGDK